MAHNITERDGMFTVRQPAWHDLGIVLTDYPTREQAQAIAHPWEPVERSVYRKDTVLDPFTGEPIPLYTEIEDSKLIVRSDDEKAELGVVSDTFEPVLNNEMYDIAEAIESGDPQSVMYETGGSLKGGRKVWLLLRLKEPLKVVGDPRGETIPYFALQNAHDGSGAFRGQSLMTRIVCDNTSQMADLEAKNRGTEFMFRHTRNVKERIDQARVALEGWRESVSRYNNLMERLLNVPVTASQRREYVEDFIPSPPPAMASDRVLLNVNTARNTLHGILDSMTCRDTRETAYGLVQASIEYGEHFRAARSKESRFKRAYLDRSQITSDALDLALSVAGTTREAVMN